MGLTLHVYPQCQAKPSHSWLWGVSQGQHWSGLGIRLGLVWPGEMAREGQGLSSRLLLGLGSLGPLTACSGQALVTCESCCARPLPSGGPGILPVVTATRNCSSERDVRF